MQRAILCTRHITVIIRTTMLEAMAWNCERITPQSTNDENSTQKFTISCQGLDASQPQASDFDPSPPTATGCAKLAVNCPSLPKQCGGGCPLGLNQDGPWTPSSNVRLPSPRFVCCLACLLAKEMPTGQGSSLHCCSRFQIRLTPAVNCQPGFRMDIRRVFVFKSEIDFL